MHKIATLQSILDWISFLVQNSKTYFDMCLRYQKIMCAIMVLEKRKMINSIKWNDIIIVILVIQSNHTFYTQSKLLIMEFQPIYSGISSRWATSWLTTDMSALMTSLSNAMRINILRSTKLYYQFYKVDEKLGSFECLHSVWKIFPNAL